MRRGLEGLDGFTITEGDSIRRRQLSQVDPPLPFCDFGEVIDPPSADVTAHVVEMLARDGLLEHPRLRSCVEFLLREQEADGSWFGRWGGNHLYGTGAAVPALIAAGIPAEHSSVRRAVRWLEDVQNDDGGWGEDLRSYDDPAWRSRGASTASQTAWALLALQAAGEREGALERGVAWLARTQLPDGGWDEPWFTAPASRRTSTSITTCTVSCSP